MKSQDQPLGITLVLEKQRRDLWIQVYLKAVDFYIQKNASNIDTHASSLAKQALKEFDKKFKE